MLVLSARGEGHKVCVLAPRVPVSRCAIAGGTYHIVRVDRLLLGLGGNRRLGKSLRIDRRRHDKVCWFSVTLSGRKKRSLGPANVALR